MTEVFETNDFDMEKTNKKVTKNCLEHFINHELLFSLQATQLSILNQTFRPLLVAKLEKVDKKYVYLKHVNIKMQNAPEFEFPTPLIIPIKQIAWFTEFNRAIRFSIY